MFERVDNIYVQSINTALRQNGMDKLIFQNRKLLMQIELL